MISWILESNHWYHDNMSSVVEETSTLSLEQDATGEEMRIPIWEDFYPQRALNYLFSLVFVFLIILLIIGLLGLKWINQRQNKCGVPSS